MHNRNMHKYGVIIVLCLILTACTAAPGGTTSPSPAASGGQPTEMSTPQPSKKPIKLSTFTIPSPTPTTSQSAGECSHDTGLNLGDPANPNCRCVAMFVTCQAGQCTSMKAGSDINGPELGCETFGTMPIGPQTGARIADLYCKNPQLARGDGLFCIGKPVIYLYPTQPTYVDVEVKTPGKIVVSIPEYPIGGWKNVLAYPDGQLIYQGQQYGSLFYESEVATVLQPKTGMTLKRTHIGALLPPILYQLGLNEWETFEFMEFWMPKLLAMESEYIFFSILPPLEKEAIDHIEISPKPDTMIAFIAYFKAVDTPYVGAQLALPVRPPKREGFTVVEWGGTIAPQKDLDTKSAIYRPLQDLF